MWLSLGMLLLLLAVTYFHSIQGLFSALLAAVLSLVCAALAFATFEYVAVNVLAQFKPDFALGLALIATFGLPLFVLRVLLDKYVTRACMVPLMLDKAGGFLFGAVAAYVMVGMLAISLQLLPWGTGFLGFTRVDSADPAKVEQNELWLQPDRFAAKVGAMLSDGVFSGETSFSKVHPDFVTEVGWTDAVFPTANVDRRVVRRFAPPGAMRVNAAWEETYLYRKTAGDREKPATFEPKKADSASKFLRVQLTPEADAQDEDRQHRYTLLQIRLVGERGSERTEQYHPIAVADAEHEDKAVYEIKGEGDVSVLALLLKPNAKGQVDVAFEVPNKFVPRFIAYKGGAREEVRLGPARGTVAKPETPPPPVPPPTGEGTAEPNTRVTGVAVTGSFFGDGFPRGLVMTDYQTAEDAEFDNAKKALKFGHIHGPLATQGVRKEKPEIARFEVPPDKRLLHLSVAAQHPGSTLGKALGLAVTTMKNYIVTDSMGRQYRPVGAYIIAKSGDQGEYVEIQYAPESADSTGRGVRPWSKLSEARLERDYTYVYLYLVEPGAKLVRFSTGGGGVRDTDLNGAELTAPP